MAGYHGGGFAWRRPPSDAREGDSTKLMTVWATGEGSDYAEKGYCYSNRDPSKQGSLPGSSGGPPAQATYRHLEGNWYLYVARSRPR